MPFIWRRRRNVHKSLISRYSIKRQKQKQKKIISRSKYFFRKMQSFPMRIFLFLFFRIPRFVEQKGTSGLDKRNSECYAKYFVLWNLQNVLPYNTQFIRNKKANVTCGMKPFFFLHRSSLYFEDSLFLN